MPVRLSIPAAQRKRYIPSHPLAEPVPAERSNGAGTSLRFGLMNNMPDGALDPTERQFIALLEKASAGISVDLGFYSLPGIPRAGEAAARIAKYYSSAEILRDGELDALIVTGREPLAPSLPEEPYWDSFTELLEWAKSHTYATIWSCLAAHAAVLHQDGVPRVKADYKYCGIFPCARAAEHPLTDGLAMQIAVPHSRWNGLSEERLSVCGYQILSRSAEAGVDTFVKQQDRSLFVYFQGHPEYAPATLLLEYRRDVGRFLRGEISRYPTLPTNYFSADTEAELLEFQERATAKPTTELTADLSGILDRAQIEGAWHATAAQMYRNLLHFICDRKSRELLHSRMECPANEIVPVMRRCPESTDHVAGVEP